MREALPDNVLVGCSDMSSLQKEEGGVALSLDSFIILWLITLSFSLFCLGFGCILLFRKHGWFKEARR